MIPSMWVLYSSYRLYLGRFEEQQNHAKEMSELHLRAIEALAVAIDAKDETTHDHLRRVQVYSLEVAKELGLSPLEIQALQAASLLHDIGKLGVPEYILSKPGRLTPEEFERIKVHPSIGAEILDRVRFPYPVVPIVAAHHEKWDGSGYPKGLAGEQIPLGARILSAVDCLDALASDRQYRRALSLSEAMEQVVSQSGSSFDPRVVKVLQRRYREFETLARAIRPDNTKLSRRDEPDHAAAPDAGYVHVAVGAAEDAPTFISSIAAARQEFQNLHELTSALGTSLTVGSTLSLLGAHLKAIVPHDSLVILYRRGPHTDPAVRQRRGQRFVRVHPHTRWPGAVRLGCGKQKIGDQWEPNGGTRLPSQSRPVQRPVIGHLCSAGGNPGSHRRAHSVQPYPGWLHEGSPPAPQRGQFQGRDYH